MYRRRPHLPSHWEGDIPATFLTSLTVIDFLLPFLKPIIYHVPRLFLPIGRCFNHNNTIQHRLTTATSSRPPPWAFPSASQSCLREIAKERGEAFNWGFQQTEWFNQNALTKNCGVESFSWHVLLRVRSRRANLNSFLFYFFTFDRTDRLLLFTFYLLFFFFPFSFIIAFIFFVFS